MHPQPIQALKNRSDFPVNDGRTQESTNTVRAVKLSIVQTEIVELLQKEILCCNMATD